MARGREPVDAREDDALDGGRDLDRDVVVEAPLAVLRGERTDVDERAHELLEVERVPLGRFEHALLEIVGKRFGSDDDARSARSASPSQWLERYLGVEVRHLARGQLADAPRRVIALVALDDDEQHGCALADREQALDELHGRHVGPVEVVEEDDERAVLSERREELLDDLERPVLQRLRREVREARRDLGLGVEAEERAQIRVDLELALAEEIGDGAPEADAHPELRIVQRRAEPLAEEVAERPVRQRLAVRDAPSFEPQPLVLGARIGERGGSFRSRPRP